MNFGTKLRTVLAVATCLNAALLATDVAEFGNPTLNAVYKAVSVILNFIIVAVATYFNNDYDEIEAKHTGAMRQEKAERKQDYVGETLMTDTYDEFEGSDSDE